MRPVKRGYAARNHPMYCEDGPWQGQTLYVSSNSTGHLVINGLTGRYVDGRWELLS